MKHILRDATSVACAPKPGKTSIMPACRHCCRRCCHRLLFFKIKVRPQSCRSYPIWLPWNCLFFRPLKFLSMFQVICQILGGDPGWLLLQCRLQKKNAEACPNSTSHYTLTIILFYGGLKDNDGWLFLPFFLIRPSVHCTMANLTRFLFIFSYFILMPDTCWRWNTDIRIGNVWCSTMGTLMQTLPFH